MGGMQIMLDKGEEYDWFASNFIRVFGFLFAAGMSGLIWHEWRAKTPIMNLRLFKFKNFAICCFLMILVGGVLNAATVLQPQFLQTLMGYTATLAGEALTGGGLILLLIMPLAGAATSRFAARNLAAFGFRLLCRRILLHLDPLHPHDELRLCRLAASSANGSYSLRLHCHHPPQRMSDFLKRQATRCPESSILCGMWAAASSLPALVRSLRAARSSIRRACRNTCSRPIQPSYIRSNALTSFFGGSGKGPGLD